MMIVHLDMRSVDEMLALQAECQVNQDLFLPTSREGYLRAFQFQNFCLGYREDENAPLTAFLNCAVPTQNARINWGRNRLPPGELNRVGHMNTLLVKRDRRQNGIGRALVSAVLKEFLSRNCVHIYVTLSKRNAGSMHLLETMDFHLADEVCIQGYDRLLMYRNLAETAKEGSTYP